VVVRPVEDMPRTLMDDSGVVSGVRAQRPPQRVRSITQWQQAVADIASLRGVTAVAPTVAGPAVAVRGEGSSAVAIRGVEPEDYGAIVDLSERLVEGDLDLTGARALVGTELAADLGIVVGDRLRLDAGVDRGGVFTVAGIFDFGATELNE